LFNFDKDDIAILIAVIALLYTMYYNITKEKKEAKRAKREFLKKLTTSVKSVNFHDTESKKEKKLDDFRDELNFCELFNDNQKDYMSFSEKLDDDYYLLSVSVCNESFKETQTNLLTIIRNFNV
jgi:glucose-6-phosphate 1-dehydrogenase